METSPNRIASLLDGIVEEPKARSGGENTVSRKCGREHDGSDLRALLMVPCSDAAALEQRVRSIRRELEAQFTPAGPVESTLLDGLVSDYAQLVCGRWMLAALQRPDLSAEDCEKWQQVQACRESVRVIERLLGQGPSDLLACGRADAECLAGEVAALVKGVEEYLAPDEDWLPEDEMDEYDREDLRQNQNLWDLLGPSKNVLSDREHVAAVLCGQISTLDELLKPLRAALVRLAETNRMRSSGEEVLERRVDRLSAQKIAALAAAPEQLIKLTRHVHRLEREIERKLRRLGRLFRLRIVCCMPRQWLERGRRNL